MPQSTFDTLLDGLTDAQRDAVTHVDGPLLVLAGPGSGKTTVVTRRVAFLIAQGIAPWQILALTFTNKASGEMRERIDRMLPEDLSGRRGLTVATFHSFCARLLRRYAGAVGGSEQYTIYDSADQRDAIKRALSEVDLSSKNWSPGSVAAQISHAKNRLLDAAAYAAEASDFYSRSIARIFTAYERILNANDALDFDDLLVRTANLLRDDEIVRTELQQRYEYLLIDEYQDTNHAQFVIAQVLATVPGRAANICVVGDPDQSIYGWRGADIRNILEFEEHYPEARVIPLGRNFRSTGHIVAAADVLIRHNRKRKDKRLHTDLGDGNKPSVVTCRDEHHEAQIILDEFRRLHDESEVPWKDMAVLYRVNALSRVLEEAFRDAQVPYIIARGTAFYERKEIKDALCYLRLVANPHDEVALRRVINAPPRGIGGVTLKKVELFAINRQCSLLEALRRVAEVGDLSARAIQAVRRFVTTIDGWSAAARGEVVERPALLGEEAEYAGGTLAEIVERVITESGLEKMYRNATAEEDQQRLENLAELVSAAAEYVAPVDDRDEEAQAEPPSVASTLAAYLESVALVSDADAIDPAQGSVTLMTLHAAKGLEFEAVAMAGLEEGLLPHLRSAESSDELEEERRLCFVGITRARRTLLMTRAGLRTHRGIRERTIESQFLRELPSDSVITSDESWGLDFDRVDEDDAFAGGGNRASGGSRRSGGGTLAAQYPVGCLVEHPTFGLGRIQAVMMRPAGASAQVSFSSAGTKTLILEYARLERIDCSAATDIVEQCHDLDFALAGIAPAVASARGAEMRSWLAAGRHGEMTYLARNIEMRLDPRQLLPGAQSVICVADRYHDGASDPPAAADSGRVARYARGDDYHTVMKRRLHQLCDLLRERYPDERCRACVDTAPVLEREHAQRAGLGAIGKHTLIIEQGVGSYLLLGAVLTTLDVAPGEAPASPDPCGTCTRCIDACPTDAITPWSVDATRCISYLTIEHRGKIDSAHHADMGDWVFGCDVCQEVCPHNEPTHRSREAGVHEAYAPRRTVFGLLEILNWTEEDRRAAFVKSAMKRAKLPMMKRNALIAAGNALAREENPQLEQRVREIVVDASEEGVVRRTAGVVVGWLDGPVRD